ncbi:unnamed protein product [Phytophthora fragariaefolia]|uniref:Unnamed protein product n=1 Tax=Phytophthora fragariaefolia TaxID=1490495 RepID=A0A9W6Y8Z7_9STRA|nr:unnamed protein product [Phytophthora fragariaefolia]
MGSRRPREDDSDASSSKRSRSGSDRSFADAGPLSSPRSVGDSTSPGTVVSRTGPVRDPWMPTPSEIHTHFGSTAPRSQYAQYSCSGIIDDDAPKELDFDPTTDERRGYYIGLFHELRWYGNKKTSPRERYERFSKRPKIDRLHWGAVEAGIPGAVRLGIACEHCDVAAVRVSERDIYGYTCVPMPEELKPLRANWIAQMSSSASGWCSTLPRAEILSNEYENDPDLGSESDDQQLAGRSSALPPVRLVVGVEAAERRRGSGPPDSVDRLEAVERLQTAEFAALRQELTLLKAQIAQASQTASNVQVDLGSRLAVLRTGVGALEPASAPSHQD